MLAWRESSWPANLIKSSLGVEFPLRESGAQTALITPYCSPKDKSFALNPAQHKQLQQIDKNAGRLLQNKKSCCEKHRSDSNTDS